MMPDGFLVGKSAKSALWGTLKSGQCQELTRTMERVPKLYSKSPGKRVTRHGCRTKRYHILRPSPSIWRRKAWTPWKGYLGVYPPIQVCPWHLSTQGIMKHFDLLWKMLLKLPGRNPRHKNHVPQSDMEKNIKPGQMEIRCQKHLLFTPPCL